MGATSIYRNLTGEKFNMLYVIKEATPTKSRMWVCLCDCGNMKVTASSNLVNGNVKSCGCLKRTNKKIYEETHARVRRIWVHMHNRCYKPATPHFERWGGRGIVVCNEWHKFTAFKEWAYKNGYSKDLTIDRINNDGNYEPSNCRWSTVTIQNRNRRTNLYFTIDGHTESFAGLCEKFGISRTIAWRRLKRGWDIVKVLTTPIMKNQFVFK